MSIAGVAIFLSAFLLFQVQLLLAKYILPWFGGTPAVWTTSLLFFQTALLAGYAYAHWLARRPGPVQRRLHLALLTASLAGLGAAAYLWGAPLLADGSWKPEPDVQPIGHILWLLAASVGLPFFALSATNPLLTAWWSRAHPGTSPYRLYALSNLGSLLGLASYPVAVEVFLPLGAQAWMWVAGYVLFAAALAWSARGAGPVRAVATDRAPAPPPTTGARLLWFSLAACASGLLLATTNQITQEIAAVPLLWMLPLVLYLLSFILCFDSDRRYDRRYYAPALVAMLVIATLLLQHGLKVSIVAQIGLYALTLFVACMALHGELARLKPAASHLTGYYLTLTAGGAAGGLFVAVLAPRLFDGFWEFPAGLWLSAALYLAALWHDRGSPLHRATGAPGWAALSGALLLGVFVLYERQERAGTLSVLWRQFDGGLVMLLLGAGLTVALTRGIAYGGVPGIGGWPALRRRPGSDARRTLHLGIAALLVFAAVQVAIVAQPRADTLSSARNFYGLVAVEESSPDDPVRHTRTLVHGRIAHGLQYQQAPLRRQPNSYYGPHSGVALALRHHPRRDTGPMQVGVIGLGVGTLATFGRAGDDYRFYEINPAVIALAHGPDAAFSYLDDSPAGVVVVAGDARLSLERELADLGGHGFDLLAVDAFSSDAIPAHLLTREAIALYLRHLDPEHGILALNISNRYVELKPLLAQAADHFDLDIAIVDSHGKVAPPEWSSDWVLLARRGVLGRIPEIAQAAEAAPTARTPLWTDDYSNLVGVLRWTARARPESIDGEGLDFLERDRNAP